MNREPLDEGGGGPARGPAAFAAALARAIEASPLNQTQIAAALNGRSQSTISEWASGRGAVPTPRDVFALEAILEVSPGELSRLLGYLPVEAVERPALTLAILEAAELDDEAREILLLAYRRLARS